MLPAALSATFLPIGLLAASPFIGSFLGTIIQRLPEGRNWTTARSCCEHCKTTLGSRDLVPVVSFAVQRGRCRYCHCAIDPFHLAVEIAAALVALAAWLVHGDDPPAMALACLLGWWLLALGWIDLRTMRLPDALTLPLIGAGILHGGLNGHALAALIGASLTWATIELIRVAFLKFRNRAALGGGDVKLLAAIGAWNAPDMIGRIVLLACVGGFLCYGVMVLRGKTGALWSRAIPFGPFLAAAFFLCWLIS
ncbi:prepilin peptidase [Brytella acorum]|uniref:Prepilin leader peptidase/N-methyltransferase n=1 Tax=Brytella acorum TaxID=2959299 RepID=A0AA35UZT7_9PROT|nr:A24 family peptidase [Brytella acorum]MDF3624772.1 A24 family peptidase [Brytella acorum]CAI9120075.1 A24 family peptidase [Brytella acorum]